jgi:hypothetical protein
MELKSKQILFPVLYSLDVRINSLIEKCLGFSLCGH